VIAVARSSFLPMVIKPVAFGPRAMRRYPGSDAGLNAEF
jgi:hypothetical protein